MKGFWRFLLPIILVLGWVAVGYWYIDYSLGSSPRSNIVTVEIAPHSSLKEIGNILQRKGIIRESFLFKYYAFITGNASLKAGVYDIDPSDRINDILNKLSSGKEDLIEIIIPPGFNIVQISDRLEANGFNKTAFLNELKNKKPKYSFEKEIPNNPNRTYRLEGYLFPGTYYFRKNESAYFIVDSMLAQMAFNIKKLDVDKKLKENMNLPAGMTLDKWITVASLIERAGQLKKELPTIAGVIYNRMRNPKNNRLMIDASIMYIYSMKGITLNRINKKITEMKHPYNTYKNPGLPPGPICSPSIEALNAALNPQIHQYEYYVTRKDGTKGHYFARTYADHLKNDALSWKNQKRVHGNR